MSALNPLSHLLGSIPTKLTKSEHFLLDAILFVKIIQELTEIFRNQYKEYFHLRKFPLKKENAMLEEKFIRFIIQDIILTGEYDITGLSIYMDTNPEIIEEILIGRNTNPSMQLVRKIIDVHISVRPELYFNITNKIRERNFDSAEDHP